jgi:hypothetical protein
MSFISTATVDAKDLGNTLFLYQVQDFMNLVNSDVSEFNAIAKYLDPTGVTASGLQYALQSTRRVSNAQHVSVGKADRPLLAGKAHSIQLMTAKSKQLEVTASFDDDVLARAKADPEGIHVIPTKLEMHNQNITSKEAVVKAWFADGTGVQAVVKTITVGTPANKVTIVVENSSSYRGSIRWIQEGQEIAFCSAAGVQADFQCAASPAYYEVESVDFDANSFVLVAKTAAGVTTAVTGNSASPAVAAGNRVMNFGDLAQLTAYQDLSGTDIDYDDCLYPVGLASHSANDGRNINGLILSGANAGTRHTASGSFAPEMIVTLMRKLEDRNGQGEFTYPKIKTSNKMYEYALNADENAVVLQPQQRARGGKVITVAYGEGDTEFSRSRFAPDYIMYAEPMNGPARGALGEQMDPIQFKFSGFDFMTNPDNNDIFERKLVSGAPVAAWVARMRSFYAFVVPHHASIGSIAGYTVPT